MRTLRDLNFRSERAVIRVDFNVPLNEQMEVADITRIQAAKPTIDYILSKGGSCVLISHLGRPNGPDPKYSLSNINETVSKILGVPVSFSKNCVGASAQAQAAALKKGEVLLMENLRFHAEETAGDITFSEDLSKLGTVYVNDAFGTAHRAHSSSPAVTSAWKRRFSINKTSPFLSAAA